MKVAEMKVQVKAVGLEQTTKDIKNALSGAGKNIENTLQNSATNGLKGFGDKLSSIFGSAIIVSGFQKLSGGILTLAGNLEQARIAFGTMLKSGEKANVLLSDLAKFAMKTPFELTGLREQAKQLLAYGFQVNEIIPMLGRLGDISAAVGIDKMPRLTYALGQVRAAGRLMGTELRQFTETGVNLLPALSDVTGYTTQQIMGNVGNLKITYEQVEEALKRLTDKGGLYYGLMAAQSKTLQGSMSNVKDALNTLGEVIGTIFIPALTGVSNALQPIIANMKVWVQENPKITQFIGYTVAALVGLIAVLGLLGPLIASVGVTLEALGAAFLGATGMAFSFGAVLTLLTGPIGASIALITALFIAFQTNFLGIGDIMRDFFYEVKIYIAGAVILFRELAAFFKKNFVIPFMKDMKLLKEYVRNMLDLMTMGFFSTMARLIQSNSKLQKFISDFVNIFRGVSAITDIIRAVMLQVLNLVTFGMSGAVQTVIANVNKIRSIAGLGSLYDAGKYAVDNARITAQLADVKKMSPNAPIRSSLTAADIPSLLKQPITGGITNELSKPPAPPPGGGSGSKKAKADLDDLTSAVEHYEDQVEKLGNTQKDQAEAEKKYTEEGKKYYEGLSDAVLELQGQIEKLGKSYMKETDKDIQTFIRSELEKQVELTKQMKEDKAEIQKLEESDPSVENLDKLAKLKEKILATEKEIQTINTSIGRYTQDPDGVKTLEEERKRAAMTDAERRDADFMEERKRKDAEFAAEQLRLERLQKITQDFQTRQYNDIAQIEQNKKDLKNTNLSIEEQQLFTKLFNDRIALLQARDEKLKAEQDIANDKLKINQDLTAATKKLNDEVIAAQKAGLQQLSQEYDALIARINTALNKKAQLTGSQGITGRAKGGPVSAGTPYLVGENADGSINDTTELMIPAASGAVANAGEVQAALKSIINPQNVTNISRTVNAGGVTVNSQVDLEGFFERLKFRS